MFENTPSIPYYLHFYRKPLLLFTCRLKVQATLIIVLSTTPLSIYYSREIVEMR